MKYDLMHKDTIVAQMIIDVATMTISSVVEINHATYLPIGVKLKDNFIDRKKVKSMVVKSMCANKSSKYTK